MNKNSLKNCKLFYFYFIYDILQAQVRAQAGGAWEVQIIITRGKQHCKYGTGKETIQKLAYKLSICKAYTRQEQKGIHKAYTKHKKLNILTEQ